MPKRSNNTTRNILIVIIAMLFFTIPFLVFYPGSPLNPFDLPTDEEGGGGGRGGGTDENIFTLYSETINENYTLIFDAKTIDSESTIKITLEDKSNNQLKHFILLDSYFKEGTKMLGSINPGFNKFEREHNVTNFRDYMIYLKFFDTISGNHVEISKNPNNITIIEGNISDYIQDSVDCFKILNGTGSLIGEYEPSNSNYSNTVLLLHYNESTYLNSTAVNLIDSSNNNFSVIYNGTTDNPYNLTNGKFMTQGGYFDGKNDYVWVNTSVNFTNNFTFETWFNIHQDPSKDSNITFFYKNQSIDVGLYYDNSKNYYLRFYIVNESGSTEEHTAFVNLQKDHWHHAALTLYNGSSMQLYLDSESIANKSVTNITIANSTYGLRLGSGSAPENFFDGTIDESRVLNISINEFYNINYFPINYNDSYYTELTGNQTDLTIELCWNSTESISNFNNFSINTSFWVNSTTNLTAELFVYNFTSSNYVEFNVTDHIITKNDFVDNNGNLSAIFNFTSNVTNFTLNLDLMILQLYFEYNSSNVNWSFYSDDTRIVLFQNSTTNKTSFIVEFTLNDPLENIFDSSLLYEFFLSEGILFDNVDLEIYLFNYSSNEFFLSNEDIEITQLNTTNEILIQIDQIPYSYFEDIIDSSNYTEKITFKFDFSSNISRIFLDYIEKTIYYMDTTDYQEIVEDYRILYYIAD